MTVGSPPTDVLAGHFEPDVVGVIDSGWDRSIADTRVLSGVAFTGADGEMCLEVSMDDHDRLGHGTSAADLILQVAPEARVLPIRVFGSRLETSPEIIVAAIDWAQARGVRLLNLSLGTIRDDACIPLFLSCQRAVSSGTIIIAAASNHGDGSAFPAVFEPVIGVGAAQVRLPFDITFRPDAALEFGARAHYESVRGLGGRPRRVTGTSFAAPIVTGHVSRLFRRYGVLDLVSVRRHLSLLSSRG